jgi:hypothetical protein
MGGPIYFSRYISAALEILPSQLSELPGTPHQNIYAKMGDISYKGLFEEQCATRMETVLKIA